MGDNDIIWNGKADTQWTFPCDCIGNNCQNCAHGMRYAVCYDTTNSPSIDPTASPTPEPTPSPSVDPTKSPSIDPSPSPSSNPTETSVLSHYIVDGCSGSSCGMADNGKPIECAFDDATKGSTMGDTNTDNIAVQCCAIDGSSADRPGCVEGVTFYEAEAHCASEGLRLCTKDEVLTDMGKSTGCGFSDDHVWTSTPCSFESARASYPQMDMWRSPASNNRLNEHSARSAPQFVLPESPAMNDNVYVIDLSSFSSVNVWTVSLFVLCVVLAVCVVYQKCNSAKGVAYAKVQITDIEMATDEDEALNA